MGFPRQEYRSGLPFPFPGYFPNPGIEPRSPALQQILNNLSYKGGIKLQTEEEGEDERRKKEARTEVGWKGGWGSGN